MVLRKTILWKTILLSAIVMAFLGGLCAEAGDSSSKAPTEFTIRANAKYKEKPFDYADAEDAGRVKRGFLQRVVKNGKEPLKITKGNSVVWDMSRYAYIKGDISKPGSFPDTVNPSLWRQAILNASYGLYEVASRDFSIGKDGSDVRSIYQVRGYDLANMSFVETKDGFIAVDVTSYRETAAAAVELLYDYLKTIGKTEADKKIHTIIYTHSHIDHYGGVLGVLEDCEDKTTGSGNVEIIAPEGFMEAAVSENVTAGAAMSGRARWMYGSLLWPTLYSNPEIPEGHGQVNNGLAIGSGAGTSGLMPPTLGGVITSGSLTRKIDDIDVEFLLAQNTEAPSEMAFYFPQYNSICLAEICNQTQHNILTPRGAQVRDTIAWSGALDEMKREWVDKNSDTSELSAWGPHTWPRWGKDDVGDYIGKQSRLYRYIHDQTVFLMNKGYDMKEIAEVFKFPEDLEKVWFNRGYYGATIFNVKAVYQKYLGWFDNNPVSLWKLPDKTSAALYAKYLPQSGGNLVGAARLAYADGQYRWVVEVLDLVRLAPDAWGESVYAAAMDLQADAFEQMGYAAESGIWRNYFLTGAWRNRDAGIRKLIETPGSVSMGPDTVSNMSTQQILDTLSTQINGSTDDSSFNGTIYWNVGGDWFEMDMEDHVLWTRPSANPGVTSDVVIAMTRDELNKALTGAAGTSWLDALLEEGSVTITGDPAILNNIANLTGIDPPPVPPPVYPAPGPNPGPFTEPVLVLNWSEDGIVASVDPGGWLISNLRIAKIGGTIFLSGSDIIQWDGLEFEIVDNDKDSAIRKINITGVIEEGKPFPITMVATVVNEDSQMQRIIVGEITAGEKRYSSGGCDAGILGAGALILFFAFLGIRRGKK